ncbi:hypothetical protein ACFL5Z_15995 [Planctomycetota bacterium]
MSDIIKTTLREPDGPEPKQPELLEQIVEEFKDVGKTVKGAGKKYVQAKAEQESAKVQQIRAEIFARAGELELKRQELLAQREKQQKELKLLEKRDKNAHMERLLELELQKEKNRIEAFNAVTERLKALKELGIPVDMQVVDLEKVAKRLLDSK